MVLEFEQALGVVLEHASGVRRGGGSEVVALETAAERVLAEAIVADRDQPPFDRSTRDGYALRAVDAAGELRVVGSVRAGESWSGEALRAGEAVEIMTGAPMPDGADAVVMVEHVVVEGERLRLAEGRRISVGENVVPRGAEARRGDALVAAGTVVTAAEVALAASCGCAELRVFERPRLAVVATGDELVEVAEEVGVSQIRNSNSYALAALVEAAGGRAMRLAIARDTRESIRARLAEAQEAELIVLSGGVSMGKFDLVEGVLAELGAEFLFTGALIQPGKPVVFGRLPKGNGWTYFFGLPGNPVSTQVTFTLFVAPLLRALAGRAEIAPRFVEARLGEAVKGGVKVTRFLPARLESDWKSARVRVVAWQGSGDIAANARANGYVVLPAGCGEVRGRRGQCAFCCDRRRWLVCQTNFRTSMMRVRRTWST